MGCSCKLSTCVQIIAILYGMFYSYAAVGCIFLFISQTQDEDTLEKEDFHFNDLPLDTRMKIDIYLKVHIALYIAGLLSSVLLWIGSKARFGAILYPWICVNIVELPCTVLEVSFMIIARNLGLAVVSIASGLISILCLVTVIRFVIQLRSDGQKGTRRSDSIQIYHQPEMLTRMRIERDAPPDYHSAMRATTVAPSTKKDCSHWVEQLPSTKCYI